MTVITKEKKSQISLEAIIEDYALDVVPKNARISTISLVAIFLGMAASAYYLLLGGLVVYMVGFTNGLISMVVSALLNTVFAILGAYIGFKEGLSSDLSSRFYGFGKLGSAITSCIYGFIFIGFLSIESAILQQTLSAYFPLSKPALYIILTLMWILFVIFGVRQVSLLNKVALPFFIVLFILMLASTGKPLSWDSLVSFQGGVIPGSTASAISIGLSTLGLSFFLADYTRFAKTARSAILVALSFALPCFLVVPLIGALLAVSFCSPTPGVYFVTAGGVIGVVAMMLSQVKIQAINSYSASLALSNLFAASINFKPGRLFWVIIANIIGGGLLFLNLFDQLPFFIEIAGMVSTAWATILCADYYLVRGPLRLAPKKIYNFEKVPPVNIAGVLSMIAASILSWILKPLLQIPALTAIPFGALLYVGGSFLRSRIAAKNYPCKT